MTMGSQMNDPNTGNKNDPRSLAARLTLMAVAMFGFGFLLVPLYDAFCEVTGLGGKTNRVAAAIGEIDTASPADAGRDIALEFVTTVNGYAPWEFSAQVQKMTVHPGGMYEAFFVARNLSDRDKVAQAVPSVAPQQAAKYFRKLDCFCFTTQEFSAGEEKEMPVRFVIDSDLPEYIDTITLSYTFFDATRLSQTTSTVSQLQKTSQ
jgi:cytochrome c oxidase assembly protein subunit 11